MKENFINPKEAAEILGVTLDTIRRWLRDGELQGVKFGRLWRIRESDLMRNKKQPE
jgi:excisionase family DNA binding protein